MTNTYTPRYVRTRNGRRRRLTIHHAATWRQARAMADDLLSAQELVTAWHVTGSMGYKPAGVGPLARCVYRLRREREAARQEALRLEWAAADLAARRRWAMPYWRVRPFSNGSEAAAWVEANCERCAKMDGCPLLQVIDLAWFGDGYLLTGDAGRIWREGSVGWADCAEWEARP